MIFENKGKENTLETLHIALNAAKERGTTLVVASSAGDTLIELIKMQEEIGTNVPMVMVGQAYGYPKQGVNTMTDERRAELTAAGVHIIHAAHALSGAVFRAHRGAQPVYGVWGVRRRGCANGGLYSRAGGNIHPERRCPHDQVFLKARRFCRRAFKS